MLDAALWAVLAFPVAAGMLLPPQPHRAGWWAQGAGLGVLAAAIAVGRARPLVPLPAVVALTAVHANFVFGMPVAAYLTGRRMNRARPVLWVFTGIFVAGTTLNIARGIDVTTWFPLTVYLVLLGVLPWLVGRYWRQNQELLHAGWERAERLEHQQRIVTERERLRERARIAQDMHDSLGHELALIAVRAGALQVAPGLDEAHRRAAAELRAGAAEATEHLREIIGVLHEGVPRDTAAQDTGLQGPALTRPARESIAELVERAHASGIPVHLAAPGPQDDRGDAPEIVSGVLPETTEMVTLAAHRVVQEALTNAAKHAPGAPVTVRLARTGGDPDTIVVSVTNQAPPAGPPLLPTGAPGAANGGHGLAGLAERVRLAGGTLHTGPTPDGGFEVTARLPAAPPGAPPPVPRHDTAPGGAPDARPHPPSPPDDRTGDRTGGERAAMSESARRLARERHQVRRELLTAIIVPAGLVAALGGIMVGYYIYATMNSVLRPDDYAALRIGTPRHQVERTLPRMQTIDSGARRAQYPEPRGAQCAYYRSNANILGVDDLYRLCFSGGRLTAKDVLRPVTGGGRGPDGENTP
ncbi:sensor histidine kinase [Actinomadura vinacea]|uniref:sensor histidine kinase n=1 Tax=Actinomadura vinacea TaxID=115336 RepID=UPI0031D05F1D